MDPIRVYKPHPAAYQKACDRLALDKQRLLFVSANGWDIAGASSFGLTTVWINRDGSRRQHLPGCPDFEIRSLAELPALLGPAP